MDYPTVPKIIFGNPEICTYCGCEAREIEHVIPLSAFRVSKKETRNSKGVMTFACEECNNLLYDFYFNTFAERLLFLQEKYIKKLKRFKHIPSWTDEEMLELDQKLRSHICHKQLRIRELDQKITWLGSLGFRKCISDLRFNPWIDKYSPKYIQWLREYFEGYI